MTKVVGMATAATATEAVATATEAVVTVAAALAAVARGMEGLTKMLSMASIDTHRCSAKCCRGVGNCSAWMRCHSRVSDSWSRNSHTA